MSARHLIRCLRLREVAFSYASRLTECAAEDLAKCPDLQTVEFVNCALVNGDAAARHLASCALLRSISLEFCQEGTLTDVGVECLARCTQLQKVNFTGCVMLSDVAAEWLSTCPQLVSVNLEACHLITDDAAMHLAKCPMLQSVYVGGEADWEFEDLDEFGNSESTSPANSMSSRFFAQRWSSAIKNRDREELGSCR